MTTSPLPFRTALRMSVAFALCVVLCMCAPALGSDRDHNSHDRDFITFDAPGAGTMSGQGTFPTDINDWGTINGYTLDGNGVFHGFVASPVPEPASLTLAGAGLLATWLAKRRAKAATDLHG